MEHGTGGVTGRLDALIAAVTGSGGHGSAVAVVRGGQAAYRGCFGLADVEWRQTVAPDTVFDGTPKAITIDFPFTWFTGYKSAERDLLSTRRTR